MHACVWIAWMDISNQSSILGFFVILFLISISFLLLLNKSSSGTLPPGSRGWPVVGESFQFLSTMLNNTPQKFIFDRIHKNSSHVFRTHLLGENCVVLCSAEANKFLFTNENKLVRSWYPTTFEKLFPLSEQTSDSSHGALRFRKILIQLLKPGSLQDYIGTMDQICVKHFSSKWENKDQVNVLDLTRNYTFSLACKLYLNAEDPNFVDKLENAFSIFASGLLAIPIDLPGTPFHRAIKASKVVRKEIEEITKQRKIDMENGKVTHAQDILSNVLSTCYENGELMGERDVVNMLIGLLIAGYDTVSSTCTSIVNYLAEQPQIYGQVYKEQMEIAKSKKVGELLNWNDIKRMKYSWNVACEALRLDPPAPAGAFREALTHFHFDGFSIPKGWKIYWSAHATHKNPKYFVDPEKFDPSRFEGVGPAPYTYVPFGGGPRMCPGKEVARLGILVFMHHLVTRFSWRNIYPNIDKRLVNLFPVPRRLITIQLSPHTD